MEAEVQRSVIAQQQSEEASTQDFDSFLTDYFSYLKA
jgi:glutamate--cysteine ligase